MDTQEYINFEILFEVVLDFVLKVDLDLHLRVDFDVDLDFNLEVPEYLPAEGRKTLFYLKNIGF